MDLEVARFNMIEQQVRPWGVTDSWVLDLLKRVPREAFVSTSQRSLAFADLSLPIGFNETMWQPKIEARMLQAAAPSRVDRVLEVGTGSGYLTALLASCAAHVTSIDIHGDFLELAKTRLLSNKIDNIDLVEGDGLYYKEFTDVPFTGKVIGQKKGNVQNGKKEGEWFFFTTNGKLWEKGIYKNGVLEGEWVSYHDNGGVYKRGTYRNGEKVGEWILYGKDGQIWMIQPYKNGEEVE